MVAACTIIYADELSNATVLANSFLRFHPEAAFAVLLLDSPARQVAIPHTTVLSLADLGFEAGEKWRLPMLFDHGELRELVEPALFELLLRKHDGPVACFSACTEILGPVSDAFEMAAISDQLVASDAIRNEWGDHGRSFVASSPLSAPSLREWCERAREIRAGKTELPDENSRESEGLLDSIAYRTIRRPGFAVNYSNLEPEKLTRAGDGYQIDGHPLRSFDFRGYDPAKPHLLSRYLGVRPRILLSEFPLVAQLCDTYREQLLEAGAATDRSPSRRFEFLPSGLRVDARMLRLYREGLAKFRSGRSNEPPSPFGPGGEEGFVKWLNEPIDHAREGVTRYMLAVYDDRPDVKAAFPDPTNGDAAAFRDWYLVFGAQELNLPAALVPSEKSVSQISAAPAAVNVAGYFRAELGLGTAARLLVAALEAADIPVNTVTFDGTANRLAHPFAERSVDSGSADTNIICVNPDQIAFFAKRVGPEFWGGRYTIGVWFWEVEDFPVSFHHAFNYVDEIWVASEFMRQTFLKVSPKPVFKFRLPVLAPTIDATLTRSQLQLPEQFIFLFSFDFLSVLERKNPLGLIEAFKAAFAPAAGPRLVIKTINGDKRLTEMEKLRYAIRGRPDIMLMDGYLGAIENATITALSDCYVSLHRSEGFGLTIAEAMALGKPVIATAYSGNLEFMTEENSYLCPASRSEVGPECEPYPAESHWSEPDLGAAADLFRRVYAQREEAEARGVRAAADLRSANSPAVAGKVISDRLSILRRRRNHRGPAPSIGLLQDRLDELERRSST